MPGPAKRPRPLLAALFTGALSLFLLGALASSYLAANPDAGSIVWSNSRPGGGSITTESQGDTPIVLYRTPQGVRSEHYIKDGPRTPLGSFDFEIHHEDSGFPKTTRTVWIKLDITNITPSPDGPPAQDAAAWRSLFVEASSVWYEPIPSKLSVAPLPYTQLHPLNFAYNALWRLAHCPTWSAACLTLSLLLAAAVYFHQSRKPRPGHCPGCGYDLHGLSAAPCPECGHAAPAIASPGRRT